MQLMNINQETCNQDGICAAVCPAGIIEMSANGYSAMIDDADKICIKCGHCVVVCPTASFSHNDVSLESCTAVEKDLEITDAQAIQF